MSEIELLWADYTLPIRDALHFVDGHSYDVAPAPDAPGGLKVLDPFDLTEVLADDPDWTSEVDGLTTVELPGGGFLWGGDGSYGSEGFAARLTADRSLVWAIFFTESNPFEEIELSRNVASFTSTSGIRITVHIDDPRRPVAARPTEPALDLLARDAAHPAPLLRAEETRGQRAVRRARGTANNPETRGMSTDELMELLRGE